MNMKHNNSYDDFSENPLASLFYQFIDILKSRCFLKEAEDLLKLAKKHYLPENRNIITRIVIEMHIKDGNMPIELRLTFLNR